MNFLRTTKRPPAATKRPPAANIGNAERSEAKTVSTADSFRSSDSSTDSSPDSKFVTKSFRLVRIVSISGAISCDGVVGVCGESLETLDSGDL